MWCFESLHTCCRLMQVRSIVCIVTSVQPRVILNGNNIVKLMTSINVGKWYSSVDHEHMISSTSL